MNVLVKAKIRGVAIAAIVECLLYKDILKCKCHSTELCVLAYRHSAEKYE